jgi:hypothetical protein
LKKPVFSKRDILPWKVPARFHWDLLTSGLFLKSEKIEAVLYEGKGPEYRPFRDFRPVLSAYQPGAQISNHRRACTQALLLYITPSRPALPFSYKVLRALHGCMLPNKVLG